MSKRLIKSYAIVLIVVILVSCVIGAVVYRPTIHDCSIEELQEINGIGEILSNRIHLYLESNKNATIEDLRVIDGIGDITIQKLKRRWR